MAFDDLMIKRIERTLIPYMEKWRPAPNVRDQVDVGYEIDMKGQRILLYEQRPRFGMRNETMRLPVALIRWYKSRNEWVLYWKRSNGRWAHYDPPDLPASFERLDDVLAVIDADPYGCFWG